MFVLQYSLAVMATAL